MTPEIQKRLAELDHTLRATTQEMFAVLRESTDHGPQPTWTFQTADGEVTLAECFGDKDDLIVIHNMGASCVYCTMWADGLDGLLPHLQDRAAVVLVSPDAPADQAKFAESRGWSLPMLSDPERAFATAMGYAFEHEGKAMNMPGCSTFRRADDGSVHRVAHAPFGPGDLFNPAWHLFALLDGGADGWQPKFKY